MELLNENNFQEKTSKGIVLIDFFATWCGPCRMMAPILNDLKDEFGEKIEIYKVDVDDNESLARQFSVMSIPTLVLFVDGQMKEKHVGLMQQDELSEIIGKYL